MKSNFYEKRTREGLGEDVRTRRDATRRGGHVKVLRAPCTRCGLINDERRPSYTCRF